MGAARCCCMFTVITWHCTMDKPSSKCAHLWFMLLLLHPWCLATVELEFLPGSPYLSSSAHPTSSSSGKGGASKPGSSTSSPVTLVKHYTLERGGGLFEGAGWVMRTSKVVTGPHWSDADKDPTHAKPPSSSEGAQHQRKGRTICSLFHLFRPNAGKWVFNITGDDKDAQVRSF